MIQWETLRQAAARTGYAYGTFKNWSYAGKLPFPVYGVGKQLRVKPEEIDAWLEGTKRVPLAYLK